VWGPRAPQLADDRAVQHVHRGEQGRGPVANIVVGHGAGPALLHRQARLGTVERLDLRLLVDREHNGMGRRIEVEPDDVPELGGKGRVVRQLEAPYAVRLEAVRRPDPLHRAQGDAGGRRHRPAGPVRRLARQLAERELDHPLDRRCRQRWQAGLPGLVAQQPVDPGLHEALLPAPDAGL
jgi:hypothetical protein